MVLVAYALLLRLENKYSFKRRSRGSRLLTAADPHSTVPNLGASGAIATVMSAILGLSGSISELLVIRYAWSALARRSRAILLVHASRNPDSVLLGSARGVERQQKVSHFVQLLVCPTDSQGGVVPAVRCGN